MFATIRTRVAFGNKNKQKTKKNMEAGTHTHHDGKTNEWHSENLQCAHFMVEYFHLKQFTNKDFFFRCKFMRKTIPNSNYECEQSNCIRVSLVPWSCFHSLPLSHTLSTSGIGWIFFPFSLSSMLIFSSLLNKYVICRHFKAELAFIVFRIMT